MGSKIGSRIKLIGKWLTFLVIILISLIYIILYLLNQGDLYTLPDESYPPTSERTVTFILIDGLSQEIFEKELAAGHLPQIQSIIEKGWYVKNGIGSFPSMTGYAYYPFLTGEDATLSGIDGLRWFDRSRVSGNLRNYVGRTNIHMNKDITQKIPLLFDTYDQYYTASINTYLNRNVHDPVITAWAHSTAKYEHDKRFRLFSNLPFTKNIFKNYYEHETQVTDIAIQQLKLNPKVQWVTFPSLDARHHTHGLDTMYLSLLKHLDAQIGRIVSVIENLNQHDRAIAIITDHGVSDVVHNLNIQQLLLDKANLDIEIGTSSHLRTSHLDKPLSEFEHKDGHLVINGNLLAFLHLKDETSSFSEAWKKRRLPHELKNYKGINLPKLLAVQEGIELVSYAINDSTIQVLSDLDSATIIKDKGGKYAYLPQQGDPLKYAGKIDSHRFFTSSELLSKTQTEDFPYGLVRLFDFMSQESGPDILITSEVGYDLAADYEIFVKNYRGGHGGLRKEIIRVPYSLYFPGYQPRSVDVTTSETVGQWIKTYLTGSVIPVDDVMN